MPAFLPVLNVPRQIQSIEETVVVEEPVLAEEEPVIVVEEHVLAEEDPEVAQEEPFAEEVQKNQETQEI
jgi:hypothetical protein